MKKILTKIIIALTMLLSILLYSRFIGIKGLKTNEITLKENIPESYDGLKIIHFADIHYKKAITEKDIKKLIKEINRNKPDIIFFTGDIINNNYKLTNQDTNFLIKQLSKLETKYGIFATLGEQDEKDKDNVKNIYIQSNITILDNNTTTIQNENNDKILIIGLTNTENIPTIDTKIPYKIILTHQPDNTDTILKTINNPSLILSSHSLNGSINLPIIKRLFLPKGAKKYFKPFYQIKDTKLYITNGIGVNQINFRLFNKPSINFYRLKKNN